MPIRQLGGEDNTSGIGTFPDGPPEAIWNSWRHSQGHGLLWPARPMPMFAGF
jgi:hypothetical protein